MFDTILKACFKNLTFEEEKIKTEKAERDQVKSVLPQSAKGTEDWGLEITGGGIFSMT